MASAGLLGGPGGAVCLRGIKSCPADVAAVEAASSKVASLVRSTSKHFLWEGIVGEEPGGDESPRHRKNRTAFYIMVLPLAGHQFVRYQTAVQRELLNPFGVPIGRTNAKPAHESSEWPSVAGIPANPFFFGIPKKIERLPTFVR